MLAFLYGLALLLLAGVAVVLALRLGAPDADQRPRTP
jgi:hypothetical protein